MATNYPTNLDTLTNPTSTDKLNSPSHADQHANANDAIEALQVKVGVNSSAVTSTHDYKLSSIADGDKSVSLTGTEILTNKTLTIPTITGLNISDEEFSVSDNADSTKEVDFEVSGATTSTKTTIASNQTANRTVTLPDATDTLVGKATTDTFTNKTVNADNNTISELETDNFKTGVIDTDENLTANSDTVIPTQQAVKGYVDANTGSTFTTDYTTRMSLTGATTPQPVFLNADSDIVPSDASNTSSAKFIGFVTEDNTATNEIGTKTTSSSSTYSHTVPAGDNRLLIVVVAGHGGTTEPTGVTFDGNALTSAVGLGGSNSNNVISVWYRYMGSSASPTTANVVVTGGVFTFSEATTIEEVDQVNGIQATAENAANTGPAISLTPNKGGSYLFATGIVSTDGTSPTLTTDTDETGPTEVSSDDFYARGFSLSYETSAKTIEYGYSSQTSGQGVLVGVEILGSQTSALTVSNLGLQDSFSGLSVNSAYYVQDTVGTIGTSAGSNSVIVGKAISTDTLAISHQV